MSHFSDQLLIMMCVEARLPQALFIPSIKMHFGQLDNRSLL